MPEINPEHHAAIKQQRWDEIVPRLVDYALRKARQRYWRGVFGGWMPGGREASDIALQAIEKVLTGERRWDPVLEPDVFKVLKGIVDSLLSHLVTGWENKYVRSERQSDAQPTRDGEEFSPLGELADPNGDPSSAAVEKEGARSVQTFFAQLHEFLQGTPQLQELVKCICDGELKRSRIAHRLGVTPAQVTNLRQQLQNRLKTFLSSHKAETDFER